MSEVEKMGHQFGMNVTGGVKQVVTDPKQAERLLKGGENRGRYVISSELFDRTLGELDNISLNQGTIVHVVGKQGKNQLGSSINVTIDGGAGLFAKDYKFSDVCLSDGFFKAKSVHSFSHDGSKTTHWARGVAHINTINEADIGSRRGKSITNAQTVHKLDTFQNARGFINNVVRTAILEGDEPMHLGKVNYASIMENTNYTIDSLKRGQLQNGWILKKGNYKISGSEVESISSGIIPTAKALFKKALKCMHL